MKVCVFVLVCLFGGCVILVLKFVVVLVFDVVLGLLLDVVLGIVVDWWCGFGDL